MSQAGEDCVSGEILVDTDCSAKGKEEDVGSRRSPKKRIGSYSYHLDQVVGCGFSSIVYRGRGANREQVALKVVPLGGMSQHRRRLLESEVALMKEAQHEHIVALRDVYYTVNHCYIVTEFCQGGSLQSFLDAPTPFDWPAAALQVSLACQYLASRGIMHRDVKPANVLLCKGVWKLADLGFAHQLPEFGSFIKEDYVIGSPLYMPLQSLARHTYSSKNDSFALGVLIFQLSTRRFPWRGRDKAELIQQLAHHEPRMRYTSSLPPRLKHLLAGLLKRDPEERVWLPDCDFSILQRIGRLGDPCLAAEQLKGCYSEQLQFCQYLHYLMQNYQLHEEVSWDLFALMSAHLDYLVRTFGWNEQRAMRQLKDQYSLPPTPTSFGSDQHHWLNNCLKGVIWRMAASNNPSVHPLLEKLMKYQLVLETQLQGDCQRLLSSIQGLTIHQSFELLRTDPLQAERMLAAIDFYQF